MWKSLVTGKVLSPNGILFKVALDPNSLFLAIKLHFFLSVTVFFRFFFFFFLLEKDLSWVLCKQMLRLGIQGKSWFMGKSLWWYSIGKWKRPFRLVPNVTGQPLVPASVSQRLGATSGWGRFPASQPKAALQHQWKPQQPGPDASGLKRVSGGAPQHTPTFSSSICFQGEVWGVSCPHLWKYRAPVGGRSG